MLALTKLAGEGTELSRSIRDYLLGLSLGWSRELRRKPLPPIYSSGVFYKPEPREWPVEEIADPYTVYERKWGDCDDLVLWRLSEIFASFPKDPTFDSLPAWPVVARSIVEPHSHVLIRLRNGELEDPSIILGGLK